MDYLVWCILCTAAGVVGTWSVMKYRIGAAEKTADKVDEHLNQQDEKLEDHGNRLTAIETAMDDKKRQDNYLRKDLDAVKQTLSLVTNSLARIEATISGLARNK